MNQRKCSGRVGLKISSSCRILMLTDALNLRRLVQLSLESVQLHIFSSGSRVGYGAVAYLRVVNACGRTHCSYVMGKARFKRSFLK